METNKMMGDKMKKICTLIIGLIVILSGCNNSSTTIELKDCNSDICGYWKLYAIDTYEGDELIDSINSLGYEKLKITKDVFEMVDYKENSMYGYQKDSYEYINNTLKVGDTTYTTETGNNYMLLSHIDKAGYKEVLYYEKIEENEYPKVNTSEGTVIYKSDTETICNEEYCGYWKLQNIIENCGDNDYQLSEDKITGAIYLKFSESRIDRIFENSSNKFQIESKNYKVVKDDVVEKLYILYTSDYAIDLVSSDKSNLIAEDMIFNGNNFSITYIVMYPTKQKACTNKYNYVKIDKSEFPNINLYME